MNLKSLKDQTYFLHQLDQTQLNFLQAVHDVLVAQSTYEAAVGRSVRPADAD